MRMIPEGYNTELYRNEKKNQFNAGNELEISDLLPIE
jgi:hypothetical protein